MGKTKFGLVAFPSDLKDDVGAIPFSLVFDEVDPGIWYMPDNFPAGLKFGDFVSAVMEILVLELKLSAEFVGAALDLLRPPPSHIVDGVKHLLGDRSTVNAVV